MNYLRSFIPWIAFACIPNWQWGALTALVIAAVMLPVQRRSGMPMDALVLEISTVAFFAVLTALAFAAPHSTLRDYSDALAFGWLALTAWGTLAVGHAFTIGFARLRAPREVWHEPRFLHINVVISAIWATAFTVTSIAIAICDLSGAGGGATTVCEVVGLIAPAILTSRYLKTVQARNASQQVSGSRPEPSDANGTKSSLLLLCPGRSPHFSVPSGQQPVRGGGQGA